MNTLVQILALVVATLACNYIALSNAVKSLEAFSDALGKVIDIAKLNAVLKTAGAITFGILDRAIIILIIIGSWIFPKE